MGSMYKIIAKDLAEQRRIVALLEDELGCRWSGNQHPTAMNSLRIIFVVGGAVYGIRDSMYFKNHAAEKLTMDELLEFVEVHKIPKRTLTEVLLMKKEGYVLECKRRGAKSIAWREFDKWAFYFNGDTIDDIKHFIENQMVFRLRSIVYTPNPIQAVDLVEGKKYYYVDTSCVHGWKSFIHGLCCPHSPSGYYESEDDVKQALNLTQDTMTNDQARDVSVSAGVGKAEP